MAKNTEKEELILAYEFIKATHDDLGPQIRKLRFIRELSMGASPDFAGMDGDDMADVLEGLGLILNEVIESFDRVSGLTPISSYG